MGVLAPLRIDQSFASGSTENRFRDDLLTHPLNIQEQVARNGGRAAIPDGPCLGVEPDRDFLRHYAA